MNVEKKKIGFSNQFFNCVFTFIKRNLPWFKGDDIETIQERGIVQYLCEKNKTNVNSSDLLYRFEWSMQNLSKWT